MLQHKQHRIRGGVSWGEAPYTAAHSTSKVKRRRFPGDQSWSIVVSADGAASALLHH